MTDSFKEHKKNLKKQLESIESGINAFGRKSDKCISDLLPSIIRFKAERRELISDIRSTLTNAEKNVRY
jgi:hypothetical protein